MARGVIILYNDADLLSCDTPLALAPHGYPRSSLHGKNSDQDQDTNETPQKTTAARTPSLAVTGCITMSVATRRLQLRGTFRNAPLPQPAHAARPG